MTTKPDFDYKAYNANVVKRLRDMADSIENGSLVFESSVDVKYMDVSEDEITIRKVPSGIEVFTLIWLPRKEIQQQKIEQTEAQEIKSMAQKGT